MGVPCYGKWKALGGDEKKDQKRTELSSKVTDALRDDAMKIAQDLGLETFIQADGVPSFAKTMKDAVSVKRELEAVELYKEDSKSMGSSEPPAWREHAELRPSAQEVVDQAEGFGREVQRLG